MVKDGAFFRRRAAALRSKLPHLMSYGALFSSKMVSEGRFVEAVETATREMATQPNEPEAYFNRAQAYAALDRFEEAVADYQQALSMDASESSVDPEIMDDELFFALRSLAASRKADPQDAVRVLERYRQILPGGRHLDDIAKWKDSFNGVETVWYRERV
jgi:tetratricopeptide (TPR) repeat protein